MPGEAASISITISKQQIIEAVRELNEDEQEALIEDLLAALSPEYLKSIREARKDYREGRVVSHDEAFE